MADCLFAREVTEADTQAGERKHFIHGHPRLLDGRGGRE
jgi:hypothetical protein